MLYIIGMLVTAGFTPDQAQQAFFYYDVQLNTAEPDQRVKDAIASKVAAQQELERQQTITDTAAKIAERRKNEGAGYGNMLTAIPQLKGQSITAEGVADVLRAIAAYDTASALGAAVEGGKLNSVVFSSAPTTHAEQVKPTGFARERRGFTSPPFLCTEVLDNMLSCGRTVAMSKEKLTVESAFRYSREVPRR